MEINGVIFFNGNGRFAPAYSCDTPGDNTGYYVPLGVVEKLQAELAKVAEQRDYYMEHMDIGFEENETLRKRVAELESQLADRNENNMPA